MPAANRLKAFRQALRADGAVVSTLVNIRYLCGFTGSNGLLWVDGKGARLFTDSRYALQAKQETAGSGASVQIVKGPLLPALAAYLEKRPVKQFAFENQRVSFALAHGLKKLGRLVALDGVLERQRMVKDAGEIAAIRASVAVNAKALRAALRAFRVGMTESELAARIDYEQRKLGASGTAFETIVAGGAHAALPHAKPRAVSVNPNGYLLIDMGACCEGYMSDLTRTYGVGAVPERARKIYEAVLEAQMLAIHALRPGMKAEEVHSITFNSLRKAKLSKYFTHSTGHGLGLEIHEAPRLGTGDQTVLEPGMVITIEPGVYVEGFGGVRIEDTILIKNEGAEVLTPLTIVPKHWTIVG